MTGDVVGSSLCCLLAIGQFICAQLQEHIWLRASSVCILSYIFGMKMGSNIVIIMKGTNMVNQIMFKICQIILWDI